MADNQLKVQFVNESVGLNQDIPSWLLPPSNFNIVENFRFRDGIYTSLPNPSELRNTQYFYITFFKEHYYLISATSTFAWEPMTNTYTNVMGTRTNITVNNAYQYTSENFNNVLVLNHPLGFPEYTTGSSQELQELPYDSSGDGMAFSERDIHFNALRAYRNFLFGLGVNDEGTDYPFLVAWSDAADINGIPSTWNPADPTNLAGTTIIGEGEGNIVDGKQAGDNFLIYREKGITQVTYTGGQFVFRFKNLSETAGIIGNNCIAEINSSHFVFGDDDIYVVNNNELQSIAHNRIRKTLFRSIDADNFKTSFVEYNRSRNEVLFAYPKSGSSIPNAAYVYNLLENAWVHWDFEEGVHYMVSGALNTGVRTYNSSTSSTSSFNEALGNYLQSTGSLDDDILISANESNLSTFGISNSRPRIIERLSLNLKEHSDIIQVNTFWPFIEASQGTNVVIQQGYQETVNAVINWNDPFDFVVGEDIFVPDIVAGHLYCIRFIVYNGDVNISGYELNAQQAGTR